jgi:pimeloyl-ACP methyl ester carboxylesterase
MTATVVLVHGAFSGAWTWRDVQAELRARGVASRAVDLPTCNTTDSSLDFHDDAKHVRSVIDEIGGPVVLAGNSYGGVVITEAAVGHAAVKRLVYIAAFMLAADESVTLQILNAMQATEPSATGFSFRDDGFAEMDIETNIPFAFNQAPPEQLDWIRANGLKPMAFQGDPSAALSGAAWQTIPSTYVVCDDDRSIRPDAQRQWAKEQATDFVEWPSDHCPQHSRPRDVADLLAKLANDVT